jgi:hypothetical protein
MKNIFRYQEPWYPVTRDPDWYEHRVLHYDWQADEIATEADEIATEAL